MSSVAAIALPLLEICGFSPEWLEAKRRVPDYQRGHLSAADLAPETLRFRARLESARTLEKIDPFADTPLDRVLAEPATYAKFRQALVRRLPILRRAWPASSESFVGFKFDRSPVRPGFVFSGGDCVATEALARRELDGAQEISVDYNVWRRLAPATRAVYFASFLLRESSREWLHPDAAPLGDAELELALAALGRERRAIDFYRALETRLAFRLEAADLSALLDDPPYIAIGDLVDPLGEWLYGIRGWVSANFIEKGEHRTPFWRWHLELLDELPKLSSPRRDRSQFLDADQSLRELENLARETALSPGDRRLVAEWTRRGRAAEKASAEAATKTRIRFRAELRAEVRRRSAELAENFPGLGEEGLNRLFDAFADTISERWTRALVTEGGASPYLASIVFRNYLGQNGRAVVLDTLRPAELREEVLLTRDNGLVPRDLGLRAELFRRIVEALVRD